MFRKITTRAATVLAVACLLPAAACGQSSSPGEPPSSGDPFADGEARFLAARDAVRSGDRETLETLASQTNGQPLDAYVHYWLLHNGLARPEPPSIEELNAFIDEQSGTYLAEKLRGDWLRRLARDSDWDTFLALYPKLQKPDGEMRCLEWNARLLRGDDRKVLDEVAKSWDSFTFVDSACGPVLRAAVGRGRVSEEKVWQLFRRRADTRSPSRARPILDSLAGSAAVKNYRLALRNPRRYLDRLPKKWANSRSGREVALVAVARLARTDVDAAHARFLRVSKSLDGGQRAHGWATLAHRAAQDHKASAAIWYRNAGDSALITAGQRAWRVRAALRDNHWQDAIAAIDKLPGDERVLPEWIYWRGRALKATGKTTEAEKEFNRIAAEPTFYGILAAEELGRPFDPRAAHSLSSTEAAAVAQDDIGKDDASGDSDDAAAAEGEDNGGGDGTDNGGDVSEPFPPLTPSATIVSGPSADKHPGFARALALFRLDMRLEAIREWNFALRGRDEKFRLDAAKLALSNHLYDRCITSAELANPAGAWDLRYLTPYREIIAPHAAAKQIDIDWIYGIMRQESRFVIPSRSSTGAQGLMQVMPRTAKLVAKHLGIYYHPGLLRDPEMNVELGTGYMRMILDDLADDEVLAAAGYNAGPGRARRWRDTVTLEGALYAETIPFDETRDYVKHVMTNTVIYTALRTGQPQSLKARLGVVAPK